MGPTKNNETAQQGLRQPRYQGKSRPDSGTKHSYSGYSCQKTIKKSPLSKTVISGVPVSPALNKRQEINSSARSKKCTDKSLNEASTYTNKKTVAVHEMSPLDILDIGKKVELQWTDMKAGGSGGLNRLKSVVIGQEYSVEPLKEAGVKHKPVSKLRNFTLSNTSPVLKSAPEKSTKITLPSQTAPTSRSIKSYVNLSQFRKNVKILVQQQVWLVEKILQLKDELHFVMCKMDELRVDIPIQSLEQSHEEVTQSEGSIQFERNLMHGTQNAINDYSDSYVHSNLSLLAQKSMDKGSMGDCRHPKETICYDKCWNAKTSTEDVGVSGHRTQLDRLLLSEDTSLFEESPSCSSISRKMYNSGGTYYPLQYIVLLALMLLQFTIQFVTVFT